MLPTLASSGAEDPQITELSDPPPETPMHILAASVDRYVGRRIRERRTLLGLSQQQLAIMIGVTYQQAHKYERGLNRVSAGRLYTVADVLAVPIAWFFEGFAKAIDESKMPPRQRMALELSRSFAAIDDERHQLALSQMARALAAQSLSRGSGKERTACNEPAAAPE